MKQISKPLSFNHFQEEITSKMVITQNNIVKDILMAIISSGNLSPDAFINRFCLKTTVRMPFMNERNRKCIEKMMVNVNTALDRIPTLSHSFDILANFTQDEHIRKKFIEKVAHSHVLALISYIDKTKKSFIGR